MVQPRPAADQEVFEMALAEMRAAFLRVEKSQAEILTQARLTNGRVNALEAWKYRVDGARILGGSVWQLIVSVASLLAVGTSTYVALIK